MKVADLQVLLAGEIDSFRQFTTPMTEAEFADRPTGRWSVADTMQHLYLSARPVLRLLAGPRDVFTQWGMAERPSRSYAVIDTLYHQVLKSGIKSPANLSPRQDDVPDDKTVMLTRMGDTYLALAAQLPNWSEEELDHYQIPHPALGLITVREMLYFIGVHTQHHIAVLQAY